MKIDQEYYFSDREELFSYIPQGVTKTLDVGCASGEFSKRLKDVLHVETWGIEAVDKYAQLAKGKVDHVLSGTFESVYGDLPKNYFDCVFFNDVLEHMVEPEDCLTKIRSNLAQGKHVIASIPNVRYVNVLRNLLFAKDWKYEDSGVMDRTHLRFFTLKSIRRMFDSCGYTILSEKGINGVSPYCLTSILNFCLFNQIEDMKYRQYIIVATPKK